MFAITRRALLASGAGLTAACLMNGRARAAEFSLRFGHNSPVTHPMHTRLKEAVDRIREQTSGRVEIDILPNNQLGGDADMLSQTRSGALDFCQPSGQILSPVLPLAAINVIGFGFKDYQQVWAALDGELGDHVRKEINTKTGLFAMKTRWDNGFRQITTSSKPVQGPQDLQGMKLRVPVTAIAVSTFKALGASPVSMQFSEVYSALQTHIVDGQENPLALIETAKIYEVQKYCSMTNHQFDAYWICANGRMWKSIPPDLQHIIETNLNEFGLKQREDVAKLNASLRSQMQSRGLAFNDPDIDAFRAKLREAGYYAEWKGKFGAEPWGLLEKYVGKLS